MITVRASGSGKRSSDYLNRLRRGQAFRALDRFGQRGVELLSAATPVETGLTAQSWTYEVQHKRGRYSIIWRNTNVVSGTPVAILIQYGHGTGTGGWVEGRDYINPVIRPLFDKIADEVWREVKNG